MTRNKSTGAFFLVPRYDGCAPIVTPIYLYACESWTLTTELQRRIQATEMRCRRKILRISRKDNVTNEKIPTKIQQAIGLLEDLTIAKRLKLKCMNMSSVHQVWPNSFCRHSERGRKTRRTEGYEVGRQHQGMDRPLVRQVPEGSGEQKKKMEETGREVICRAPTTLAVKEQVKVRAFTHGPR